MSGIPITGWEYGYWGKTPTLYQEMSEGYPTGEFVLRHMTHEHLRWMADWMITLPEDQYRPLAHIHQALERMLLSLLPNGVRQ